MAGVTNGWTWGGAYCCVPIGCELDSWAWTACISWRPAEFEAFELATLKAAAWAAAVGDACSEGPNDVFHWLHPSSATRDQYISSSQRGCTHSKMREGFHAGASVRGIECCIAPGCCALEVIMASDCTSGESLLLSIGLTETGGVIGWLI